MNVLSRNYLKVFLSTIFLTLLVIMLCNYVYAEDIEYSEIITGIVENDKTISVNTHLLGIIIGNVTVNSGCIFSLEGSVIGDLTIEEGSSVVISGILEGNLYNN